MNSSNHKSDFVNVNGIRLHYLDWGGVGRTLIFLTGMGSSAYIYNKFAPRFTDRFRVLALTYRETTPHPIKRTFERIRNLPNMTL